MENEKYLIKICDGVIVGFYDKNDKQMTNLAVEQGECGAVRFTLVSDDITAQPQKFDCKPYIDRISKGKKTAVNKNEVEFCDDEYDITTVYSLDEGLTVEAYTENETISQFGISLEMNFLGKPGTKFQRQILPTSPYTSDDKKYTYCIMTRPEGGFLVCTAITECGGWKIDYSSDYCGHYIEDFVFLASFDKAYGGSAGKRVKINLLHIIRLKQTIAAALYLNRSPLRDRLVRLRTDT